MPSPDHFDYGRIPQECRRYADLALLIGNPGAGDMINSAGMLRTMDQVLMDLATDDPVCLRLMERKNLSAILLVRCTMR